MRAKTEKALQEYTKRMCTQYGVLCYKFSAPSKRGVPDLLLIGPMGHVLFVELKSPAGTGRLSPLQVRELKIISEHNTEVYIVKEYEEIEEIIISLTTERKPAGRYNSVVRAKRYPFNRQDGSGQDGYLASGHR